MLALSLLGLTLAVGELPDRGIFPELTATLDPKIGAHGPVVLRLDAARRLLTVLDGDGALAVYPIAFRVAPTGRTVAALGLQAGTLEAPAEQGVTVTRAVLEELRKATLATTPVEPGPLPVALDHDRDGIADQLDIALGAKKLLQNKAQYIERYVSIKYPGGDVPRTEGVCSDTVIRAMRNAGIDLQREVHEDILRNRGAYKVVEKVDASINHRRVKTLLPWFVRHFRTLPKGTPHRPGDIVFFDTFPTRPGPDHLGVISDRIAPSGLPYVINNWSDGAVDAEMDLLSFVPVTHHFRVR